MGSTRRSITLPRMNAHRLVIVAAALTEVVAATLAINGSVGAGQAAQYTAILRT
jgi:hypothetical protein